jgi:hypothetical protein
MSILTIFILVGQAIIGGALAWSCFCRLVRTDGNTVREIRWAIVFEAAAALFVMGAPYLPILMDHDWWPPLTTPMWVWFTLLAAACGVQIATARYWKDGVPADFQRGTR